MLVHRRHRFPEYGLVPAFHGTFLSVLILYVDMNQFSQKKDFSENKEEVSSVLFW